MVIRRPAPVDKAPWSLPARPSHRPASGRPAVALDESQKRDPLVSAHLLSDKRATGPAARGVELPRFAPAQVDDPLTCLLDRTHMSRSISGVLLSAAAGARAAADRHGWITGRARGESQLPRSSHPRDLHSPGGGTSAVSVVGRISSTPWASARALAPSSSFWSSSFSAATWAPPWRRLGESSGRVHAARLRTRASVCGTSPSAAPSHAFRAETNEPGCATALSTTQGSARYRPVRSAFP